MLDVLFFGEILHALLCGSQSQVSLGTESLDAAAVLLEILEQRRTLVQGFLEHTQEIPDPKLRATVEKKRAELKEACAALDRERAYVLVMAGHSDDLKALEFAHSALGLKLLQQGRLEEAEEAFFESCRKSLKPNSQPTHQAKMGLMLYVGVVRRLEKSGLALRRVGPRLKKVIGRLRQYGVWTGDPMEKAMKLAFDVFSGEISLAG